MRTGTRTTVVLIGCAVLLVALLALGLSDPGRGFAQLSEAIADPASLARTVTVDVRLPRLLLGALIGAGAYYLSREQNRKALDAKLAELGLKDGAGDVSRSVAQGWEKTREAAHTAGTVIADKAAEVKDAAAGGTQAAVDKAKEVAGDVKQAVTGAAETARDAASKAADTVKDKAQDVGGKARDAAQDLKADAKDAADKAGNQGAQTLQDIKWGAKDAAKDAKDAAGKAADDVKSAAQKAADGAKDAAQNAADSAKKAADDQKKDGGQKA